MQHKNVYYSSIITKQFIHKKVYLEINKDQQTMISYIEKLDNVEFRIYLFWCNVLFCFVLSLQNATIIVISIIKNVNTCFGHT